VMSVTCAMWYVSRNDVTCAMVLEHVDLGKRSACETSFSGSWYVSPDDVKHDANRAKSRPVKCMDVPLSIDTKLQERHRNADRADAYEDLLTKKPVVVETKPSADVERRDLVEFEKKKHRNLRLASMPQEAERIFQEKLDDLLASLDCWDLAFKSDQVQEALDMKSPKH